MDKHTLLTIIQSEIDNTTGCTDPVVVALTVAYATQALARLPHRIDVLVSPNIYKNALHVSVPGTGQKGIHIAAALGGVVGHSDAGLTLLGYVNELKLAQAESLLANGAVTVHHGDVPDRLYVRATVAAGSDSAYAITQKNYSHLAEIGRNGQVTFSAPRAEVEQTQQTVKSTAIRAVWDLIHTIEEDDLAFLVESARVNRAAAETGMHHPQMKLGPRLNQLTNDLPMPWAATSHAGALVGAAAEARMAGLQVPIVAVAGSGNQGIAALLGALGVAEMLGSSDEQLARALAISAIVTIAFRGHTGRMTTFCASALGASAGVAAATVYLLGGSYDQADAAMRTTLGSLSCIMCDGAQEACAYKVRTAVVAAIDAAYLAADDVAISPGVGLLGNTIEDTFRNLGTVNNRGLAETEQLILELI